MATLVAPDLLAPPGKQVRMSSEVGTRRESIMSGSQDPPSRRGSVMMRRPSFYGKSSTHMLGMRRMSRAGNALRGFYEATPIPKAKLENTYKMSPDEGSSFCQSRINEAVKNVTETYLDGITYEPDECKSLTRHLASVLLQRVKDLNIPRYKMVCNVYLGSLNDQGLEMASRCLWNSATDNFTHFTYKNNSLFAVITVHGIYFE